MTRLSISLAALVLAAGTAFAQQKGGEEKSGPQMQGVPERSRSKGMKLSQRPRRLRGRPGRAPPRSR